MMMTKRDWRRSEICVLIGSYCQQVCASNKILIGAREATEQNKKKEEEKKRARHRH